jgi:hypothetical protein
MSAHPSTFRGETEPTGGAGWDDPATLHRTDDGGGVFSGFKSVRSGTVSELVHFVLTLPESEQEKYCIDKEGDHRLSPGDIAALARRPDFPESA